MPDFRELLTEFDIKEAKRINDTLAPRPTTLDRIMDALGSPAAFWFYLGVIGGCFATVSIAAIWEAIL